MMTRLEVVTALCELQAEAEELKRLATEHSLKTERLIRDIQYELSNE